MKNDAILFKNSYINTFKVVAQIVLVITILTTIGMVVWHILHEQISVLLMVVLPMILLIAVAGVLLFLLLMAISKILEHLLHIRISLENKN